MVDALQDTHLSVCAFVRSVLVEVRIKLFDVRFTNQTWSHWIWRSDNWVITCIIDWLIRIIVKILVHNCSQINEEDSALVFEQEKSANELRKAGYMLM